MSEELKRSEGAGNEGTATGTTGNENSLSHSSANTFIDDAEAVRKALREAEEAELSERYVPDDDADDDDANDNDAPVNASADSAASIADATVSLAASKAASDAASSDATSPKKPVRPNPFPNAPKTRAELAEERRAAAKERPNDPDADEDEDEHPLTLLQHLDELRHRLVRACIAIGIGFLACYGFAEQLFNLLVAPLLAVMPEGSTLIFTELPEAFFTYIKISAVAGLFLTSPYVFYQVWAFVAPGLYDSEKKHAIPMAIISATFFVLGASFGYFVVFPYAFNFFMSFNSETIQAMPRLGDYLNFSLKLLIAFGVIFEMPLFTFFLARMGIATAPTMRRVRKYAVLVSFIVAAILTPPDVVSQFLMAVPLLILYEISIFVAQFVAKKKEEERAKDGDDDTDSASDNNEDAVPSASHSTTNVATEETAPSAENASSGSASAPVSGVGSPDSTAGQAVKPAPKKAKQTRTVKKKTHKQKLKK